jgi:hypothetical protein
MAYYLEKYLFVLRILLFGLMVFILLLLMKFRKSTIHAKWVSQILPVKPFMDQYAMDWYLQIICKL